MGPIFAEDVIAGPASSPLGERRIRNLWSFTSNSSLKLPAFDPATFDAEKASQAIADFSTAKPAPRCGGIISPDKTRY